MWMRLLFVCLGNICRSPTAEAVAAALAPRHGLSLTVDSAGTGDWHLGQPPDPRMQAAARDAGYDLSGLRARQIDVADFLYFDLIVAMDRRNLADIEALRRDAGAPARLLRPFGPDGGSDVPDPYLEGGFPETVALIERAVDGLLARIAAEGVALLHRP